MTHREYKTDQAFKTALEDRIRKVGKDVGWDMHRVRQLFLFDRYLVRVFAAFKERVILKGGVALELRLSQARTTRDVDLRLSGDTSNLLDQLRTGEADVQRRIELQLRGRGEREVDDELGVLERDHDLLGVAEVRERLVVIVQVNAAREHDPRRHEGRR